MKAVKITIISSIGLAVTFSVFFFVFYYGDWFRLMHMAAVGFFIGFVGAPEFEPKAFKKPWLLQLTGGAFAGIFFGLGFNHSLTNILMMALIGAVIGWSAQYWVKHVPIP